MPLRLIAQRLGISVRTAQYDLSHAIQKMRGNPTAFSLALGSLRRAADTGHSVSACGSVECDRQFIALYGEVQ